MDARSWGWPVESRPYRDYYCKTVRDEEVEMGESLRRDEELERIWGEEVRRRRLAEETKASEYEWTDDETTNGERSRNQRIGASRRILATGTLPLCRNQSSKALHDLDGGVGQPSSGGSLIHGWD